MKRFNKYGLTSCILLFIFLLVMFYGTSLSCNYHIKITTPTEIWDGVCQLGQSSWLEESGDSLWHVEAQSFAIGDQIFFVNLKRVLINKATNKRNSLDNFNYQAGRNMVLSYGVYKLTKNKLIVFQRFPSKKMYISTYTGNLSLFSNI